MTKKVFTAVYRIKFTKGVLAGLEIYDQRIAYPISCYDRISSLFKDNIENETELDLILDNGSMYVVTHVEYEFEELD